ncbi:MULTISPECIES: head maturation protease, ClpP-related [Nocardia]|uniref:head maturation protease, ClpP-related n=1 Tax=Nocardia TaxID=1817 RepID=UPI0007A38BF6|nr:MULTISPECIES: head maturation protease, ClpP-related [Nocardia]
MVNGPSRNRGERPAPWYRIQNLDDGTSAEVLIYDEIDPWWGVSAATFAKDLAKCAATSITVRINSPGGDVYEAIALLNTLRGHPAHITTVVDGLAASAASFVAMAGDEVVVCRNAELMIHDAWVYASGNADELRKHAENLDRISNNIASIYAEKAGGTVEEWRAVMQAETWFSASEAVAAGLADRVELVEATALAPVARFDLSAFNYAGRQAAPAPRTPSATEAEANQKGTRMSALASIAKRLGVAEDADEATITAAFDKLAGRPSAAIAPVELPFNDKDIAFLKALVTAGPELLATATAATTEGVSPDVAAIAQPIADSFEEAIATAQEALTVWGQDGDTAPAPPPAEEPAPAANRLPAGVVAIDRATLTALQEAARRGDQARTEQERAERIAAVDTAVRTGRIAPASRNTWLDRLNKDPRELSILNALEPVFPVGVELGHAGTIHDDNSDDVYSALFGKDA